MAGKPVRKLRADEALRNAHEELERAYRLQGDFLENVTHEVRTPLTAIQGYARMILEGLAGPVTREQEELLKKLLAGSDHLLEIVESTLEVARLRSGRVLPEPTVCGPERIVDKAVSSVLPQANERQLQLNREWMTPACPGIYDEQKTTIILTNLLSNAIKFTESGSVDVIVKCDASGAEIIVADTGVGISDSHIESIFDEFIRVENGARHKPSGFGIGLAIVARMVEAIGADLTVSSREGVGTAFTLRMPVLQAPPPDQSAQL